VQLRHVCVRVLVGAKRPFTTPCTLNLALLLLLLAVHVLYSLQSPYHCNLLVAGFDEGVGASLYWLDYLATLHKVNTGGTGYGACQTEQL
jgi:20S proteasome alpha/beta subunit